MKLQIILRSLIMKKKIIIRMIILGLSIMVYGCTPSNLPLSSTIIPSTETTVPVISTPAQNVQEFNKTGYDKAQNIIGAWKAYGMCAEDGSYMGSNPIPEDNLSLIEDDSIAFLIDEKIFDYYGKSSGWTINENMINLGDISEAGLLYIIDQDTIQEAIRGDIIVYKRVNSQPQHQEQSSNVQEHPFTQGHQEQSSNNQDQPSTQEGHWEYIAYAEEGALVIEVNQLTGEVAYKTVCPVCGKASSTVTSRYLMGRLSSDAYCQNNQCSEWGKPFSVVIESNKEWVWE